MSRIYCANPSCEFNKEDICTAPKVSLSWHSVLTVYDGRQEYNRCKTYQKSRKAIEIEKMMEGIINGQVSQKAGSD